MIWFPKHSVCDKTWLVCLPHYLFCFFYKHAFWFFAFSSVLCVINLIMYFFFLLYHKLNFLVYLIYSKYLIIIQKAHVYTGNMDCSLLLLDIEVCYSVTNPVDSKF